MTKDKVESARVGRLVRAKPKQCFHNTVRVVCRVPGYEEADYVEGVIVPRNHVVTEHGWVELNGVVIDPTLPHDGLQYFPGLRFRGQRGLAEAMQIPKPKRTKEDFPVFYRFGWGGLIAPTSERHWLRPTATWAWKIWRGGTKTTIPNLRQKIWPSEKRSRVIG